LILSLLNGFSLAKESIIPFDIKLFKAIDMDNNLLFVQSVGLPVLEGDSDPLRVNQITVFVQAYSRPIELLGFLSLFHNFDALFTQVAVSTFTLNTRSIR
jgi:hypothetical protein